MVTSNPHTRKPGQMQHHRKNFIPTSSDVGQLVFDTLAVIRSFMIYGTNFSAHVSGLALLLLGV